MDADKSKRALEIVARALERDPETRQALVQHECADDPVLRAEVDRILALEDEGTGISFLERAPDLTVRAVVADPLLGRSVGHYKIVEILGEGGFGVVYLAEQTKPVKRRVALKVIKPGMDSKAVIARFEAERQALAMMSHPSVAKVFDAGTTEQGRPYFVMELVTGVSITEHCDRHKLNIEERLRLFMEVCEAVQHAHQKGIIHRDIKPSNILVEYRNDTSICKVIDFGVAKAIEHRLTEQTIFTQQGQLIGTLAYMSPEQAEMTAQDIDTRSDIYSLGVVLYQLLTGATPFQTKTLLQAGWDEIRRVIREQEPQKPSTKVSSIGSDEDTDSATIARNRKTSRAALMKHLRGDLDWITIKSLEKDRTRRYATATELEDDLRRHLRHEPVLASPPSSGYRFKKFVRRNRSLVAALLSIFIVFTAGSAIATYLYLRAETERHRTALAEEKSESLTQFLMRVFMSTNPMMQFKQERAVTVEVLLGRATDWIHDELADQPAVEATFRATIGNAYRELGKYEKAERNLLKARAIRERIYGPDHVEVATAIFLLGWLETYRGDLRKAEGLHRQALEMRTRLLGGDHFEVTASLNSLAFVLHQSGRFAEAEELERQVLERALKSGSETVEVAWALHTLGWTLFNKRKLVETENLFRRAIAIRRKILGLNHLSTGFSLIGLGHCLVEQGRYEEAESTLREALDIHRQNVGDGHPETAHCLYVLAILIHRRDGAKAAEQLHRDALRIYRNTRDANHPETALSMGALGKCLLDQKKFEEAERYFQESIALLRKTPRGGHAWMVYPMDGLARCHERRGEYEQAEVLIDDAIALLQETYDDDHVLIAEMMSRKGEILVDQEKYKLAEPLLLDGLRLLTQHPAFAAEHARAALERIVKLYEDWNKPAEAAGWQDKLSQQVDKAKAARP